MKFPYNLSLDRLSLLSKEDRELYELEHSIYYSHFLKSEGIKEYQKALLEALGYYMQEINDDIDFEDISQDEKEEMAKALSRREAIEIFDCVKDIFDDALVEGGFTAEEWHFVKETCLDYITNMNVNELQLVENNMIPTEDNTLEEDSMAPGHDQTYWIPDLGWLGTLGGALLGGLAAGIGGLLIAGKDLIAAKLLERYMNKLVELIDNGQNKRKSIFSYFGSKNSGNESQGCFRSIQENVERTRYTQGLIWAKAAGIVSGNGVNDAIANNLDNGGLGTDFYTNIASKINELAK